MDPTDIHLLHVDRKIKLWVGTWNVGNKMPPTSAQDIEPWIPQGGGEFDVIALGLQESSYKHSFKERKVSVDGETPIERKTSRLTMVGDKIRQLSPRSAGKGSRTSLFDQVGRKASVALNRTKTQFADVCPFVKQLEEHLGENYKLAILVELLEMRLVVFVHQRNQFSAIEKATEATGVGNFIGNKGGLVGKLLLNETTTLCFISCHLAAHEGQKFLDKRNADSEAIFQGARIGHRLIDLDSQFHHTFWVGDLNYRIDTRYNVDAQEDDETHEQKWKAVHELIQKEDWTALNDMDQLEQQIAEKKAFVGWNLPRAMFAPTFKRLRHEIREYTEQRIPSYCDRIMWKSLPGCANKISLEKFDCVEEISTSDHKPVYGSFRIDSERKVHIPAEVKPAELTQFTLKDFSAENVLPMDLNGSSDPYLKFYIDPIEKLYDRDSEESRIDSSSFYIPTSKAIRNTLNPVWEDSDLPSFKVIAAEPQHLSGVHLIIVMIDYDAAKSDDPMGQCVISLSSLTDDQLHGRVPLLVSHELIFHGKPAGTLHGKIFIHLPKARHGWHADVRKNPGGCCTIL